MTIFVYLHAIYLFVRQNINLFFLFFFYWQHYFSANVFWVPLIRFFFVVDVVVINCPLNSFVSYLILYWNVIDILCFVLHAVCMWRNKVKCNFFSSNIIHTLISNWPKEAASCILLILFFVLFFMIKVP